MTPRERALRRAEIALGLRIAVRPILGLLRPRPSREEWRALIEALYPAVYRARMEYWRLAQRAYRDERLRATGDAGSLDFPRRNYAPEALDKGLSEQIRPKLDGLQEDDPIPEVVVEEALEVMDRHGRDAGRQGEIDAARHDPRALGYARRLTGAYNCAFCTMLASRGPVYRSANAALIRHVGRGRNARATGEPFHNGCDCEVVPVFDRDNWEGRDQYLELSRLWDRHANSNLKDWRRYLASRREESTGQQQAA